VKYIILAIKFRLWGWNNIFRFMPRVWNIGRRDRLE